MQLRIIADPFVPDTSRTIGGDAEPGDMWRAPWMDIEGREAWAIVLPNRTVWYTTQRAHGVLWEISGEPPSITVTPSIWDQDPENGWHGWIRDGRLVEA